MNGEILIELVRNYPLLYDLSNPKYTDTEFKSFIWSKIDEEIATTGLSCKTRWANMRDNFRKSLKKNEIVSGQKAKSVKKYKYSEQMSFLKNFFNEKETRDNIVDEVKTEDMTGDEEMNENIENNDTEQLATQVDSPVIEKPQSTPTQTTSSLYSTQINKRKLSFHKKSPPKTAATTIMEYLIKEKESSSSLSTHSLDPVDAFLAGIAIAPALKKLSPHYWHYVNQISLLLCKSTNLKCSWGKSLVRDHPEFLIRSTLLKHTLDSFLLQKDTINKV